MIMPKEGEGPYICKNCGHTVFFPLYEGEKVLKVKIGLFGRLQFPKCPKCGSRKFERYMRWQA